MGTEAESTDPLTRREVADMLRTVIDPELGMNIVDLGLVYDIRLSADHVEIDLTMTTPACPMQRYIHQQVDHVVRRHPQVREVQLETVWRPPWSPSMIHRSHSSSESRPASLRSRLMNSIFGRPGTSSPKTTDHEG